MEAKYASFVCSTKARENLFYIEINTPKKKAMTNLIKTPIFFLFFCCFFDFLFFFCFVIVLSQEGEECFFFFLHFFPPISSNPFPSLATSPKSALVSPLFPYDLPHIDHFPPQFFAKDFFFFVFFFRLKVQRSGECNTTLHLADSVDELLEQVLVTNNLLWCVGGP